MFDLPPEIREAIEERIESNSSELVETGSFETNVTFRVKVRVDLEYDLVK